MERKPSYAILPGGNMNQPAQGSKSKLTLVETLVSLMFVFGGIGLFVYTCLTTPIETPEAEPEAPPPAVFPTIDAAMESLREWAATQNVPLPISPLELAERREKLCDMLHQGGKVAFVAEPSAGLRYLVGNSVQWKLSERPFLLLITPVLGDNATGADVTTTSLCLHSFVVPAFELARASEVLSSQIVPRERIFTYQENESAFAIAKSVLNQFSNVSTVVSVDTATRLFIATGLEKAGLTISRDSSELNKLRVVKSENELAILRFINVATKRVIARIAEALVDGMSESEVNSVIQKGLQTIGFVNTWTLALFEENAAFPHGTKDKVFKLDSKHGTFVLIDAGGEFLGYQSDITRTFFFDGDNEGPGAPEPEEEDLHVWNAVRDAQRAALAAIRPGVSAASVDKAARDAVAASGFPGDYAVFTHRLGHGIGLEGHEEPYLNKGNDDVVLEPGMVFSVEPGIYIPKYIGVRLEDIVVVTEDGYEVFGSLAEELDEPFHDQ